MEAPERFAVAYPALRAAASSQARRVLRCAEDRDEVVQEALLRAYASWTDIEDFAPQWVSRVALNLALSRLRRRHRSWPASLADLGEAGVEARVDLSRALEILPLRQREVVVLRYLADLPERDIAQLLEISAGTVKRHLHRALERLRSPASALSDGYATPPPRRDAMDYSWRTMFVPAVEPADGWPTRPWDHRHLDDGDRVVRVALDQSQAVVLDAEGDEVQSGPGFDYELAKVRRGEPKPQPDVLPLPTEHLTEAMVTVLDRAERMGEVFGHSWVGTEHVALALVEALPEAATVIGAPWDMLADAIARFYDGPLAVERLEMVHQRLSTEWQPRRLADEVPPAPNWAVRRLLHDVDKANEFRAGGADPAQVAEALMDPRAWSLVNQLLRR